MSIYSHTNTSIDRWVDGWVGRGMGVLVYGLEKGEEEISWTT